MLSKVYLVSMDVYGTRKRPFKRESIPTGMAKSLTGKTQFGHIELTFDRFMPGCVSPKMQPLFNMCFLSNKSLIRMFPTSARAREKSSPFTPNIFASNASFFSGPRAGLSQFSKRSVQVSIAHNARDTWHTCNYLVTSLSNSIVRLPL